MILKIINILPIIIMVESFLAAIPLTVNKNYGSALYWISAGLLNMSVIFLIRRYG